MQPKDPGAPIPFKENSVRPGWGPLPTECLHAPRKAFTELLLPDQLCAEYCGARTSHTKDCTM